MLLRRSALAAGVIASILYAGRGQPTSAEPPRTSALTMPVATRVVSEQRVQPVPISGPLSDSRAEVSGMAWAGDALVVLPQYPNRFVSALGSRGRRDDVDGALFAIPRREVIDFVDGRRDAPLSPRAIPFASGGLSRVVAGYEGLEAIAFRGDRVFVTVERVTPNGTSSVIVSGRVAPGLTRIELDPREQVAAAGQTPLVNMGYEALVVTGDSVVALYEANGAVNAHPQAISIPLDPRRRALGELDVAPVEYRITDATPADREGRFWAVNTFWPGMDWRPGTCPLARRFGIGRTHARSKSVERLVEMRIERGRVALTDTPPIELELSADGETRNWEAIAELDGRGFLLMTDEHPATELAFVAHR